MTKILHVTTTDLSLELLLGPQLEAFVRQGYEVIAASAPGPYVAAVERRGVRHIALQHATRSMEPTEDARFTLELYRVVRSERPDVVHLHNPKPGWFGRPAARLAGAPVVVNTVHGIYASPDDSWPRRAIVYALERFAASFSDAELVQSLEDVRLLRNTLRVPAERLVHLGNGVDLERFDPDRVDRAAVDQLRSRWLDGDPAGTLVVGVVGRLVWEKGLAEVFEASRQLRTEGVPVRFVLVGPLEPSKADSVDADELARQHAETGALAVGEHHDMDVVHAAFDLFVLASHREGFPRSAMEAAAMGRAVIATNIRGCREVVDDGRTGVLFPRGNAAALADAVRSLVEDPKARAAMGAAGHERARSHFDQRRLVETTIATYERLLVASAR